MLTPSSKRILRSPVLHFLLAGGMLFGLAVLFGRDRSGASRISENAASSATSHGPSGGLSDGMDDPGTIRVERADLIAFIQSRTRMALAPEAERAFDSATEAVRRDWIDRYVREEALVREARSLGLDRSDELIRRRLVQQMEFLVEDVGSPALLVSQPEITAAYRQREEELREPETIRFAHVFVRDEKGREAEAEARARSLLARLNRERVGFDGALPLGDRFLYDRSYVDRTLAEVRSHFGELLAETVASIPVDAVRWTGPHRSEHGLHLVLLTARSPSRLPPLAEVEDSIRESLLREKREQMLERGIDGIVSRYAIEVEPDLGSGGSASQLP